MSNKVKCKKCGDIIESLHSYDFRRCKCKSIFIDGGNDYMRLGWPEGQWEDWIEILNDDQRGSCGI